ncbi:MAG: LLM class flavin-dependent oxidoreductase [Chloroflexi bacterium]|nr:LLM class flavin-dependent oxidoreductase [Chloroflexota bacterium]MCZ6706780.1 LLM class flavin-dependent oxidoreductase [Chloroflexota bacterium]
MQTDLLLIPFGADYAGLRRAAVAAEESGFDGIWTWDHLQGGGAAGQAPVPECWTVLTALAEATSRVTLGPLVLNVANRDPGTLANMAATLQEVSEGRLVLGIGAGGGIDTPYGAEQQALGRPVPGDAERRARLIESIRAMRALWSGDGEFEGRYYQIRNARGFMQPSSPPPIVVGGFGPKMAALAGEYADGFNLPAQLPSLPELAETAREAHSASTNDGPFEISAFTGLQESYLRAGSRERTDLEQRELQRLILLTGPPFDVESIREAGRVLVG